MPQRYRRYINCWEFVVLTDVSNYRKGYATLDYEDEGWRQSKLQKMQLLVNKQPVDAISRVVHMSQVERIGRQWVTKFKEHVDRQMFGKFSHTCSSGSNTIRLLVLSHIIPTPDRSECCFANKSDCRGRHPSHSR